MCLKLNELSNKCTFLFIYIYRSCEFIGFFPLSSSFRAWDSILFHEKNRMTVIGLYVERSVTILLKSLLPDSSAISKTCSCSYFLYIARVTVANAKYFDPSRLQRLRKGNKHEITRTVCRNDS